MAARGHRLRGVRIDSGDLVAQSRAVREALDAAGFRDVQILLSGDLNEHRIAELLAQGAAVDAFGVGTDLGTSADAPSIGGVYKLVEDEKGFRIKLSTGKATLPGRKQVWRRFDAEGQPEEDLVSLIDEPAPPGAVPLLQDVMRAGTRLDRATLEEIRRRCTERLAMLPEEHRTLDDGATFHVALSARLGALKQSMHHASDR
jgi:nicotinate phosphoribosyltransferase